MVGKLLSIRVGCLIFLCGVFLCVSTPVMAENDAMGHGGATDVLIARVNGAPIDMSQLMKKMQEVAIQKYGTQGISPLLATKIKAEAIDKLIIEELAYQKAKETVLVTAEMVAKHIAAVKEKRGGDKGLAEYLQDEGWTADELKIQAERFLAVKLFVEQEIESKIVISDQEIIDAYIDEDGKFLMQKESVQVNKIIFFMDPEDSTANDKIADVIRKMKDEADSDPAKLVPDGTFIVQENVKLGKVRDSKLFEVGRKLGEYEFSEPFESDGTLFVLQLTGYRPEIVKDVDEAVPYIRYDITKKRRQAMLDNWMAGLKEGAKIEIMDLDM